MSMADQAIPLSTIQAPEDPSPWVTTHADKIRAGGRILDLACGSGRNARWLAAQGWQVEAVDRNQAALDTLQGVPRIQTICADLENGSWPYAGQRFDGIVVCRYLHRPLLDRLAEHLQAQGILLYETFMVGHEQFGRPTNPDFLLRPDELLDRYAGKLAILAFEQGRFDVPKPSMQQRICAQNPTA
jgi:SAM-dependent methyltransferase